MRTFKQLQDDVLAWMADQSDTGLMRTLVKNALNEHHQQVLHEDRYDFMLWPRSETLAVVPGTSVYALHPQFDQPLYVYNAAQQEYLEEIPARSLLEAGADWATGTPATPDRFMLTGISKVATQPTTPGTVTVTTTGGNEVAGQSVVISGVTGEHDDRFEHYQVWSWGPSGFKFEMRHVLRQKIHSRHLYRLCMLIISMALLTVSFASLNSNV